MLTFSNPSDPSTEAEYHRWYTQVHIPQLLAHVPGIRSAARYQCGGDAPPHRYLVVYEVDGEEEEIRQAIAARIGNGTLERSPALQLDPPPVMLFVDPIDDHGSPLATDQPL
jgi:hypothetical protein